MVDSKRELVTSTRADRIWPRVEHAEDAEVFYSNPRRALATEFAYSHPSTFVSHLLTNE